MKATIEERKRWGNVMRDNLTAGNLKARLALLATFTSLFVFVPVLNSGAASTKVNFQARATTLLSNSSALYVVVPSTTPVP